MEVVTILNSWSTIDMDKANNIEKYRKVLIARFKKSKLEDFCDHEVLEFFLSFVTPKRNFKSLGKSLLKKFHGLESVLEATYEDLESTRCIDENTAVFISSLKEIAGVYLKERVQKKNVLRHSRDVLDFLKFKLSARKVENFLAIYLNSKKEVIDVETLHVGTANKVFVCRRKALESALRKKADSIIFVHNHPSGDPAPSLDDQELASILQIAALAIDISVHDHLIIGKNTYFSWRENGLMTGDSVKFSYFTKPLQRMLADSSKNFNRR